MTRSGRPSVLGQCSDDGRGDTQTVGIPQEEHVECLLSTED